MITKETLCENWKDLKEKIDSFELKESLTSPLCKCFVVLGGNLYRETMVGWSVQGDYFTENFYLTLEYIRGLEPDCDPYELGKNVAKTFSVQLQERWDSMFNKDTQKNHIQVACSSWEQLKDLITDVDLGAFDFCPKVSHIENENFLIFAVYDLHSRIDFLLPKGSLEGVKDNSIQFINGEFILNNEAMLASAFSSVLKLRWDGVTFVENECGSWEEFYEKTQNMDLTIFRGGPVKVEPLEKVREGFIGYAITSEFHFEVFWLKLSSLDSPPNKYTCLTTEFDLNRRLKYVVSDEEKLDFLKRVSSLKEPRSSDDIISENARLRARVPIEAEDVARVNLTAARAEEWISARPSWRKDTKSDWGPGASSNHGWEHIKTGTILSFHSDSPGYLAARIQWISDCEERPALDILDEMVSRSILSKKSLILAPSVISCESVSSFKEEISNLDLSSFGDTLPFVKQLSDPFTRKFGWAIIGRDFQKTYWVPLTILRGVQSILELLTEECKFILKRKWEKLGKLTLREEEEVSNSYFICHSLSEFVHKIVGQDLSEYESNCPILLYSEDPLRLEFTWTLFSPIGEDKTFEDSNNSITSNENPKLFRLPMRYLHSMSKQDITQLSSLDSIKNFTQNLNTVLRLQWENKFRAPVSEQTEEESSLSGTEGVDIIPCVSLGDLRNQINQLDFIGFRECPKITFSVDSDLGLFRWVLVGDDGVDQIDFSIPWGKAKQDSDYELYDSPEKRLLIAEELSESLKERWNRIWDNFFFYSKWRQDLPKDPKPNSDEEAFVLAAFTNLLNSNPEPGLIQELCDSYSNNKSLHLSMMSIRKLKANSNLMEKEEGIEERRPTSNIVSSITSSLVKGAGMAFVNQLGKTISKASGLPPVIPALAASAGSGIVRDGAKEAVSAQVFEKISPMIHEMRVK